ncbi:MAG: DJ-1/PfpI family protein [Cyclobacteriaceae bacterium]
MRRIFLLLLVIITISCKNEPTKRGTSTLAPIQPAKELNAAFLIVDGVYNSELVAPMDVLHHTIFHTDPAIKVFTVAERHETITSFEGLKIIPDYAFSSDSIPSIDILVVPSAEHSMDSDLQNESLTKFVRTAGNNASYIMSLCDGAFVLANAGLLDVYESTTFPGDIQRYKETFPDHTVHEGVSFVHDRKAITSAGGAKSYDPALYLVELLYGKKVADGIAKGLVIDWQLDDVKHIEVNR